MKRILFVAALLSVMMPLLYGAQYESPMLDLKVPSGLQINEMYFSISHKFNTPLSYYADEHNKDPFAVIDGGANVNINIRYMLPYGVEASAGYITRGKEKNAGLSWNTVLNDLHFGISAGADFFTFENIYGAFDSNFMYMVSVQSEAFFDGLVSVVINAAYDGFDMNPGFGAGVKIKVIKNLYVAGEYIPVIRVHKDDPDLGTTGQFNFGVMYQTFGHQFKLKFGNSGELSLRKMMLGTYKQDVYAGFEIMRLITF